MRRGFETDSTDLLARSQRLGDGAQRLFRMMILGHVRLVILFMETALTMRIQRSVDGIIRARRCTFGHERLRNVTTGSITLHSISENLMEARVARLVRSAIHLEHRRCCSEEARRRQRQHSVNHSLEGRRRLLAACARGRDGGGAAARGTAPTLPTRGFAAERRFPAAADPRGYLSCQPLRRHFSLVLFFRILFFCLNKK